MRLSGFRGCSLAALLLLAGARAGAQTGVPVAVRASAGEVGVPARAPRAADRAAARVAEARRAERAPAIDGRDDDQAWRGAQVIDEFLEYEPTPGATPRFRTEVRVLFDDKYLYVGARMFDPAPDSIISLLSRRDVRTQSEQLKLVVDSYHDRRTAYQFILNPAGVKRDYYVYNDAVEDVTWDAVWDGAARVDSAGWVAEFRIPLSQLRFPKRDAHTFGLLVVRDVARTGQRISWPLYRRDRQGYVSQAGEIGGFSGFATPRRLEVAPYVVTKNVTQARPAADAGYTHPQQQALGADMKYGLTSNLTVDATINPDFGQVEADPAVLNLGAFEQFFEERRPFFLEGAGIFTFRNSCNDIDTGCRGLFYSRRIGRAPQLSNSFGDATSPLNTTILGAAKLTGRLPNGMSVGVLNAVTQRELGTRDRAIEPGTNYFVARAQQDLNEGQGDVGFMLTAVNRDLDTLSARFLRRAAYTGGADFRHRFFNRNYELHAQLSGSLMRGSRDAILALQRDGVHRYQRPDDALAVDPTRTSLFGDAQRLSVSKFGGGRTRFQSVYQRFGPGFEINDLGFQQRADEQLFRNWFAYQVQQPQKLMRQGFFNFNAAGAWTTAGLPTMTSVNTNWHVQFHNMMWAHWGVSANSLPLMGDVYDDREARGGPAVRRAAYAETWAGVEGDNRKAWTPYLFAGLWRGDEGNSTGWWVEPSFNFRLASQFSASVGTRFQQNTDDSQWFSNVGAAGADTTRYTFARLEQRTLSMTTRLNYTATPTLSFQFYGQPYIAVGDYSNWRELADARAERYADRFQPYGGGRDPGGLDFKQLRTNSVLRWEYRPGSTLFVVWAHGRDAFTDTPNGRLDVRREYQDLFALHPNNTFLVKLSYWLNP
jgi:hypothetical protein